MLEVNTADFSEQVLQSATEEKVVYLINKAALSIDESQKINALKQVQELLVYKEPHLLDRYINDVLAFQNDKSVIVKKAILDFMEETCRKNPQNLSKVLGHINIMLRDGNAILQKRVIQIATTFYKLFLEWVTISTSNNISDMTHQIWIFMKNIKSYILNLQESENDGIRTQVIKFMEMIVLCQSSKSADSYSAKMSPFSLDDIPERHKFLRYLQLEEESKQIFSNMINLCGSNTISHSNLNTLLGSLTDIALQRPQYMAKVISTFETLYNNIPPTLAKSQVSSIKKGLKNRLLSLIKHPSSIEHQSQMINILLELGVLQHEITRNLPKVSKLSHTLTDQSKRAKISKLKQEATSHLNTTTFDNILVKPDQISEGDKNVNRIRDELYQSLNPENVAQLVMLFMPNLPENIPDHFINHYQPIKQAGSHAHILTLAELLSQKLFEPTKHDKSDKDNVQFEIVSSKNEPITKWKTGKDSPQSDVTKTKSSISFSHLLKKSLLMQKTPTYDLIQRSLKLRELINKVESAMEKNENLMEPMMGNFNRMEHCRDAAMRILEMDCWLPYTYGPDDYTSPEKTQLISQSSKHMERISIITKLAQAHSNSPKKSDVIDQHYGDKSKNLYGECLREVIDYLLEDLKGQYDLAIALLYKEYAQIMELSEDSERSYNTFFSLLIETAIEKTDCKEELLPRLLIEAPLITSEVIDVLRNYCLSGNDNEFYLNTFMRVADLRPKLRKVLLTRLIMDFVSHPTNQEIRKNTLTIIYDIYESKDYNSIIENYALKLLAYLSLKTPSPDIYLKFNLMKNCPAPTTDDVQWTDETMKICLHLFLSILPINHKLIQNLFQIYIESLPEIKRVILRSIELPIRTMGVESTELINAIKKCPKGAETLVTRIVHILTARGTRPNMSLVKVVRWLYESKTVPDVRLLIPVINGLPRDVVLALLPKFISLSSVPLVKEVLTRIITIPDDRDRSILTPSELLVAFHMISLSVTPSNQPTSKTSKGGRATQPLVGNLDDGTFIDRFDPSSTESKVDVGEDGTCDMRILIRAIGLCFANKRVFTPEVLAITMESLVEVQPLPVLFMRLVIQSIVQYPQLIDFIIKILYELLKHEVWKQKQAWIGFVKCCERCMPQSLPVLLHLSPQNLLSLLEIKPEFKEALFQYSLNLNEHQRASISKELLDIVDNVNKDEVVEDFKPIVVNDDNNNPESIFTNDDEE